MDKTTSWHKVGTFCGLFVVKEWRKTLKGKPDKNLYVDFFSVRQIRAARYVPIASFYGHINAW